MLAPAPELGLGLGLAEPAALEPVEPTPELALGLGQQPAVVAEPIAAVPPFGSAPASFAYAGEERLGLRGDSGRGGSLLVLGAVRVELDLRESPGGCQTKFGKQSLVGV